MAVRSVTQAEGSPQYEEWGLSSDSRLSSYTVGRSGSETKIHPFPNGKSSPEHGKQDGCNQAGQSYCHRVAPAAMTVGDIFEVTIQLLKQCEVRACLEFMEALNAVKEFSSLPVGGGVLSIVEDHVTSQFRNLDSKALLVGVLEKLQAHGSQTWRNGARDTCYLSNNSGTLVDLSQSHASDVSDQASFRLCSRSESASFSSINNSTMKKPRVTLKAKDNRRSHGRSIVHLGTGNHRRTIDQGGDSDSGTESEEADAEYNEEAIRHLTRTFTDPASRALGIPTSRWICHPEKKWRILWDCLGFGFIMADIVWVPLHLGFDIEAHSGWHWTTTAFFAADIVVQFCTGYWSEGTLIMAPRLTVQKYLKSYFLIDFCATLPWEYVLFDGSGASMARVLVAGQMLRLLRLLRIVKLCDLLARLQDIIQSPQLSLMMSLFKMCLVFVLLCHWCACLFGALGDPAKVDPDSANLPSYTMETCEPGGACEGGLVGSPWLRRYGMDGFDVETQYLISLQHCMGLLTGSEALLSPGFWGERIFTIIMNMMSFLLGSLVLSNIVVVVGELNQQNRELQMRIRQAKSFMVSRKVPQDLQVKVKQYLIYEQKASTSAKTAGVQKQFMSKLSSGIRLELTEHMNRDIILRHPFFQQLARPTLQRICASASTVLCAPADKVVQRGHAARSMAYIVQGTLKVMRPSSNHSTVEHLPQPSIRSDMQQKAKTVYPWSPAAKSPSVYVGPPSWLGDVSLFTDTTRANTVFSLTHSELLTLTRKTVLNILSDFPKAWKQYEAYRERVMRGDLIAAGVLCMYCKSPGHFVGDCANLRQDEVVITGKVSRVTRVATLYSQEKSVWHNAENLCEHGQ
eukprot:gnl/MRDRNA2_/MRDRNA2_133291_c0_seq1.p1 gnl/MRDRNA2_/MRDRNA2_133291_c0~~gnl/MRDRNA2_/MRDRNA2_133291_c0_seq1.p1  ORF type:complete len:854 (-),score=100.85 gnl/MRDRNA2_/MRDRNA2_133291_c0_seq1:95-2656(-)